MPKGKLSSLTVAKIGLVLVAVAFAVAGIYMLRDGQAATYVIEADADRGTKTGNVTFGSGNGATGTGYHRFGDVPQQLSTPTGLRTAVGGDSIGIVWYPVSNGAGQYATTYNVFRNGVKIATTAPDDWAYSMQVGSSYIDRNVTRGQTYTYQVQAVAGSALSPLTASVSVTHPTSTVPVPNVVVDASVTQHLPNSASWIKTGGVDLVKAWYPKIAHAIAYPDYNVPSTITIKALSLAEYESIAGATGGFTVGDSITINPSYSNKRDPYVGHVIMHEAAHVAQYYDGGRFAGATPRWAVEGIADWSTRYVYNTSPWWPYYDNAGGVLSEKAHYTDTASYRPGGWFMSWLQNRYDAQYIRKTNIASHKATFGAADTVFADGKNYDEAWATFRGISTRTGPIRHPSSGRCLDDSGGIMTPGNKIILYQCTGNVAQKMTVHPIPDTANNLLIVLGHCVEAANSSTTNNLIVWINYCRKDTPGQHWVQRSDGSFLNPNSNRCLAPYNGGTVDGTSIVITDCNGSASQRWTAP